MKEEDALLDELEVTTMSLNPSKKKRQIRWVFTLYFLYIELFFIPFFCNLLAWDGLTNLVFLLVGIFYFILSIFSVGILFIQLAFMFWITLYLFDVVNLLSIIKANLSCLCLFLPIPIWLARAIWREDIEL